MAENGKAPAAFRGALQTSPKVLVSCRGKNGENNALAVAYYCNCSFDPPMVIVGIVPSRYSHHMVKETGCFVVNLPEKSYQETFDYLGKASGRDEDKFAKANVRFSEGTAVSAPVLDDCPVSIECRVVDSIMTGSHEMFVGKIEAVHARADLVGSDGKIDYSKLDLI